MSWAFLIYLIDVLTTDGTYGGWGFLMFIAGAAYVVMYAIQKCYEETDGKVRHTFFSGQNLVLNQNWNNLKAGETVVVSSIDNSDGTVKLRYPNGDTSNWLRFSTAEKITAQQSNPNTPKPPVRDLTKGPRKVAVWGMIICFIGIVYANFMPQKETAYKMLAAYVGQNVVESPRTQQLADSTIKYLDAQIKKYTDELDATAKAEQAAKAKEEKESK